MPYEIDLGMPPAGYAISSGMKGETMPVQCREFTSSDDGWHFIQRVEGFPDDLIREVGKQRAFLPSQIDTLLAIYRLNGQATVYVNETDMRVVVRAGRDFKAGQAVFRDDIVEVGEMDLGVQIPDNCGVLLLFSVGWRKGLFFDFGPVCGDKDRRQFSCARAFGRAYCEVAFQERFRITDVDWNAIIGSRWFPFVLMKDDTINQLLSYVRSGWDPDALTQRIIDEVSLRADGLVAAWERHATFSSHISIFRTAIERFLAKDYVSCTSLLYPRIEGLLRTSLNGAVTPSPRNLINHVVASRVGDATCLLLPKRFEEFLEKVYFSSFDPTDVSIGASRHSVAHGVASSEAFDAKASVLAILILHQIYYFLGPGSIEG